MSTDADERVAVKTYVPAYQRDRWRDHAAEMDMSLSEFVRTMTQAGRREFDVPTPPGGDATGAPDSGSDPRGSALEDRVVGALRERDAVGWESLREAVTDGVEERLDDLLAELQESGRVRYSGREGGYTLVEEP